MIRYLLLYHKERRIAAPFLNNMCVKGNITELVVRSDLERLVTQRLPMLQHRQLC